MKTKIYLLAGVLLLMFSFDSFAQTIITASGTYNGDQLWEADTVKITGDVAVNGLLTISPGAYVEFQGHYSLTAPRIVAEGTIHDSIVFTIHDTTGFYNRSVADGGWKGINVSNWESVFDYCSVSYGKMIDSNFMAALFYTVYEGQARTKFSNSVFRHNYSRSSLFSYCSASFENVKIMQNEYGTFSNGVIHTNNCLVEENRGAFSHCYLARINSTVFRNNIDLKIVSMDDDFSVNISNCDFYNNFGLRIGAAHSRYPGEPLELFNTRIINNQNVFLNNNGSPELLIGNVICNNSFLNGLQFEISLAYNNTISGNSILNNDAMITVGNSFDKLYNNIIYGNKTLNGEDVQIVISNDAYRPEIVNCDIEGFDSTLYKEISGKFEDNIDEDPLFINASTNDFHLNNSSLCINAGIRDTTGLRLSKTDLDGNPRVADGRIDLGAYEYQYILEQPVNQTICERTPTTIETEANGNVIFYQWQKNGKDIPSANQRILNFNPVNANDSGYYNCVIIADSKTISTDTVRLTVDINFEINGQTTSFGICPGKDTLLSVNTSIADNLDFQWYKNSQIIAGGVSSDLEFTSSENAQTDIYYCIVSNKCNSLESKDIDVLTYSRPALIPMAESYSACKNEMITLSPGSGLGDYKWSTGETTDTISVSESGVYSVIVTNANDCSDTAFTEVTIYDLPRLQLPHDTTIAVDETLNIDAGTGYKSYLWNTGSENEILTLSGLTSGVYTYSVRVTDQNNCYAADTIQVSVQIISNILEAADQFGIKIFPNPGKDILYLKTSKSIEEVVTITITDNTGKIFSQKKINGLLNTLIYQIDVSDLLKGVYYLQLSNKQLIKVEKIVII